MSTGPRVRRASRTRIRGRPPSISKPVEGSDTDQSSWIADDICTRCSALAPHGKLYCSEKCREQDSETAVSMPANEPKIEELSKALSQLRYPMTLSPHLTAATAGLPLFSKHPVSDSHQSSRSFGSSPERRECDGLHRSPSHSSDSIGSEKSESELTSPSPWQVGLDVSEENEEVSDNDDLTLPPSVVGASPFATSRSIGTRMHKFKSGSFTSSKGPQLSSPTLAPHSVVSTRSAQSPIQFTRMPCSTNIPSSVLYANPKGRSKSNIPATLRRFGSDPPSERHSPPLLSKSRSQFSNTPNDCSVDLFSNHLKPASMQMQSAPDQNSHNADPSPRQQEYNPKNSDICSSGECQNSNQSIHSIATEKQSSGSCDEPTRGRSLRRTGHSCCSGHRRLDAAACDPYCILSLSRSHKNSHPVPSNDFVFPLCPTEPSA